MRPVTLAIHDRAKRRGGFLVDLGAATLVLGIATALTMQMLGTSVSLRRGEIHRRWALLEAENVLERVSALEPGARTGARLAELRLDTRVRARLTGGELEVKLGEPTEGLIRIAVAVRWREGGVEAPPVRLVTWVAAGDAPGGKP